MKKESNINKIKQAECPICNSRKHKFLYFLPEQDRVDVYLQCDTCGTINVFDWIEYQEKSKPTQTKSKAPKEYFG